MLLRKKKLFSYIYRDFFLNYGGELWYDVLCCTQVTDCIAVYINTYQQGWAHILRIEFAPGKAWILQIVFAVRLRQWCRLLTHFLPVFNLVTGPISTFSFFQLKILFQVVIQKWDKKWNKKLSSVILNFHYLRIFIVRDVHIDNNPFKRKNNSNRSSNKLWDDRTNISKLPMSVNGLCI